MILVLAVLAVTVAPVQAFNEGNRLYAAKDFPGAARAYETALQGGPNAAVEYNLGNALFKSGQIGRAILFYRRARYLAPRDADVVRNLAFARSYRVDRLPATDGPLARALDDGLRRLSHRESALLAALAFLLASVALGLWIVRRGAALSILATALYLVAAVAGVSQQVWKSEIDARPAVVVIAEARALSAPDADAKEILLLHDGTEVRIRENRGDYLLVQLPGGNGGWIAKTAVERVYL